MEAAARGREVFWRVGDASGVDEFVRNTLTLEPSVYVADWAKHGYAAGPIRNRAMLDTPSGSDLLLVLSDRGIERNQGLHPTGHDAPDRCFGDVARSKRGGLLTKPFRPRSLDRSHNRSSYLWGRGVTFLNDVTPFLLHRCPDVR